VIALLYVASVPWYRDPDAPLRIVLGLPDWVAVAIGCYAAAACLNAAAWWLRDDPEEGEDAERPSNPPNPSNPPSPAVRESAP
jgi:hypothetical protein